MDEPTVRPYGNRILVELEPLDEVNPGGMIVLPQPARENAVNRTDYRWALVLDTGPGRWLPKAKRMEPTGFEPGDRVLVNAWVSDPVQQGVQNPADGQVIVEVDDVAAIDDSEMEEEQAA